MKWKTKLVDASTLDQSDAYIEGMVFYNPYRGLYAFGTGKLPRSSEDNYVEVQIGNNEGGNASIKQWWNLNEIQVVRQQPVPSKKRKKK